MTRRTIPLLLPLLAIAAFARFAPPPIASADPAPVRPEDVRSGAVHQPFDALLKEYVRPGGVAYNAWTTNGKDHGALDRYVRTLESVPISDLGEDEAARDGALAYWINLYNAATLRLVLEDYPVDSIKDLGGFLSSPWDRKLVTVEGTELTLNDIENRIIRAKFAEPRIHFALNCASRSCPPLRAGAFTGPELDTQLEEQTRAFLTDGKLNRVEGDHYRLSKIFDWYKDDFEKAAGTVTAFVRPYLKAAGQDPGSDAKVKHVDYDWSLNDVD
ncbi:DUF547 domain-containing protein, partial [bacterium]|nr:DUF547 domain-containing protein [bacterium]